MVKILFCGDVINYAALLSKLQAVHSSKVGPFDVALCTRLAGPIWQSLSEQPPAPIPIYALADTLDVNFAKKYSFGTDAAHTSNVTYLGTHGLSRIHDLTIAWSNGSGTGPSSEEGTLLALALHAQEEQAPQVVDVLLTTLWPADIISDAAPGAVGPAVSRAAAGGSAGLARVAAGLAPRYHFTGGGDVFFQRAPYTNAARDGLVTRFISLASTSAPGEGKGEGKWMHALSLPPAHSLTEGGQGAAGRASMFDKPAGTTESPYEAAATRKRAAVESAPSSASGADAPEAKRARVGLGGAASEATTVVSGSSGRAFVRAGMHPDRVAALQAEEQGGAGGSMFWGQHAQGGQGGRGGRGGGRGGGHQGGGRGPQGPPPDCWFCLASPTVEKHLLVSIGSECYLALPKGGINLTHLLVVPIQHCAALAAASQGVKDEMKTFLDCLATWMGSKGLHLLFFERVLHRERRPGEPPSLPLHTHMQLIGLPTAAAAASAGMFKSEGAFRAPAITWTELGGEEDLAAHVVQGQGAQGAQGAHDTCEYLYVDCPNPSAGSSGPGARTRLLHKIPPGTKHPVQFGREVLCRLLGAPERLTWKNCVGGQEEETRQTGEVRASFAPHDFTLNL